tara:strand:+ start:448 stop:3933 length:3486 start_codon:yes stop_codon:yes gene_type:complete
MAQQANRFGLDEVRTQLAAPIDNFVTQGPLNTSLTQRTRSAGINSFTKALGELADKEKAKKIHNDTIDAQLASAYNKEQPKGLEPEAIFAFNKSEDAKIGLTVRQNLLNYATVEAADILASDISRKEKLSQITIGMQSIVNLGKQGISPANAAAVFPLIEADFHKYIGKASADLAVQKKEEESSINAQAIDAIIDGEYSQISTLLTDTIAGRDTISEDDDASPEEYAEILNNVQNGLASKGFSIKKFNEIQKHILQTGRGAGIKETQLTILNSMMSRLLKAAQEGDALVDPKIITNLINGLKGNPNAKGSKLRAEISGNTVYGKEFKELEDNFRSKLKTVLSDKRTLKNNATKDRDNNIGNMVFDAPEGTYTQEQGRQILKGMTNFKSQNSATKRWDAQFTENSLNGSTSPAYINALVTSSNVLTPNGKEIDETAFAIHVNEYNLKPEAAKALRKVIDPRSKASEHRKRVLGNSTVMKLRESFKPTVKAYLKNLGMRKIVSEYFKDGESVPTPIVLAGIAKKFGAQSVIYNKASQILNAELEFTKELEGLIIANPDKEAEELALMAEAKYDNLFKDVITGKSPGSTEAEKQKAIIEKRLEKSGKSIGGEPPAASGAVTTTLTPAQEKAKIKQEKKIAISKVLEDVKDPDTFSEYVELSTKEFEAEKQIVKDNHKLTGVTPATRGEKMKLFHKYEGTPTGRGDDIGVSERAVAAIATNPEVGLILRAKALQTAEGKKKEELSKNVFTFRTPKEIQKNIDEGKNLLRIGNFQFTTDDLKGLTLKNTIEFPGNVAFYFKRFIDDIRVFRGTDQPLRPKIDIPDYEGQTPQEPTKEKEEASKIEKAKESILEALSPKEAGAAGTSQDADFDPDAKGPRGFTGPASKPLAVKPEGAKGATGEYPQYGEQYTGGTSEESDIEGLTGEDTGKNVGEEVDMPPIVMDEIVISETKPNRAQQRLEAFNQAFPDQEPSERVELRKLQDTMKFQDERSVLEALSDIHTDYILKTSNGVKASSAIDTVFGKNDKLKAALLSQFIHETGDLDPLKVEKAGGRGFGLIQFTGKQRTAFKKWLKDNNKTVTADSTLEYLKILMTGTTAEVKSYHDIGAGHRKTLRQLIKTGTIEKLTDFITDKVVGPFDRDGVKRKNEIAKRRRKAKHLLQSLQGK